MDCNIDPKTGEEDVAGRSDEVRGRTGGGGGGERSCRRLMVLLTGRLPEDECPPVLNGVMGKALLVRE